MIGGVPAREGNLRSRGRQVFGLWAYLGGDEVAAVDHRSGQVAMARVGHVIDQRTISPSEIDLGKSGEWMVDPDSRATILGMTYEFSQTGERKAVWYTPNKRRAKSALVLSELAEG